MMTNKDDEPRSEAQHPSARTDAAGGGEHVDDPVMGRLKALYDDVASEPLPDDLLKLLDKLDQVERSR